MKRRLAHRFALLISLVVLIGSSMTAGLLALLAPQPASAANLTYYYTDSNYTAIKGPGSDPSGSLVTYNRRGSPGEYTWTHFDPTQGNICHDYNIRTSSGQYDGATTGTLSYGSCDSGAHPGKPVQVTIVSPQKITGTWIDHSHIVSDGKTYFDNVIDDNLTFHIENAGNDCEKQNKIDGFHHQGNDLSNATASVTIHLFSVPGNGNNNCVETRQTINLSDPGKNYDHYFAWQDSGTISTSDKSGMILVQKDSNGPFYDNGNGRSSDGKCQTQIVPSPSNPGKGTLILRVSSGQDRLLGTGWPDYISGADLTDNGQGCKVSKPLPISIADPIVNGKKASSLPANSSGAGNGGTGNTADSNKPLGCEFKLDTPISWIICPIVGGMVVVVGAMDKIITSQLDIQPGPIFGGNGNCSAQHLDSSGTAYYCAWQSFRNLALGLMAIAGLVVIIAQALGMEILDAYTIRKILPRLLIAAIAITLSWALMQFAINLSDDLGLGIRHLIYAPFAKLNDSPDLTFGSNGALTFFGGLGLDGVVAFAGVGTALFTLAGGWGAMVAYAGTAILAVLVAVIVLILRQVVVIMLMLLSPLAMVAYILPNTQRLWRLWWESFSRALLMFPLIAGFIAAGKVFSAVSMHGTSPFAPLLGFVAYFAPYFMIPLTFRMAGATMGALGNFVNSRAARGFEGLNKFRAARRQAGRQRIQAGNLYRLKPRGSRKGRLNAAYSAIGNFNPDEISANPRRWKSEARALRERHEWGAIQKALEHPSMAPIMGDDDTSQAALYGKGTREDARRYLEAKLDSRGRRLFTDEEVEQKLSHIDTAKRALGEGAFRSAAILSAVQASTAYGTDPITGEHEGIGKLLSDIDLAAEGNDQVRAQMIGRVKQLAQQAGRMDLVAPFSAMYQQSKFIGETETPAERLTATQRATDTLTDTIVDVEGAGFILGGKGQAVENLIPGVQRRIERTANRVMTTNDTLSRVMGGERVMMNDNGRQRPMTMEDAERETAAADREYAQVMASTAALHDVAGQVSPEKGRMLADVLNHPIPGTHQTVVQGIDDLGNDENFLQMRTLYERRYRSQAAGAAEGLERHEADQARSAAEGQGSIPTGLQT